MKDACCVLSFLIFRSFRFRLSLFASKKETLRMTHRASTPTGSNSWKTTKTKAIHDRNRYRSRIYPSSSSSSQNCAPHTSRRDENTNSPNIMNNKNSRSKGRERKRTFYRRQRGRVPSSSSSLFAEGVSDTDDVLILYTKPGCCLCEGLEEKLKAVLELAQQREREITTGDVENNSSQNNHVALDLREYALEIRDVSLKKEWADAHAGEIPVLFVGKRGDADDAQTASKVKRPTPRVSIERLKLDLEKHLVSLASNSTREDNASKTNEDDTRGGGGWKVISAKPF